MKNIYISRVAFRTTRVAEASKNPRLENPGLLGWLIGDLRHLGRKVRIACGGFGTFFLDVLWV